MSIRPPKRSHLRHRRSRAPASNSGGRSALATRATSTPFCCLTISRNENPDEYLAGFPWHPHRGIETITYVLAGSVEHGDSLGNRGHLGAGDIQWMTAGSGILHQEMPKGDPHGRMHGFQLWANLPSSLKMTDPRYQDVEAKDVPEVIDDDGTRVRVVVGNFWGKTGPVEGVAADPRYLDVSVPPGVSRRLPVDRAHNAFAYVFEGAGEFKDASQPRAVATERVANDGVTRWTWWVTDHLSCSTTVTRSPCGRVTKGSGSCLYRGDRWRSQWPGRDRS